MTGLCLIISFIHASGKAQTMLGEDHRSWGKMAIQGSGRTERKQTEQGRKEEVQQKTVLRN